MRRSASVLRIPLLASTTFETVNAFASAAAVATPGQTGRGTDIPGLVRPAYPATDPERSGEGCVSQTSPSRAATMDALSNAPYGHRATTEGHRSGGTASNSMPNAVAMALRSLRATGSSRPRATRPRISSFRISKGIMRVPLRRRLRESRMRSAGVIATVRLRVTAQSPPWRAIGMVPCHQM